MLSAPLPPRKAHGSGVFSVGGRGERGGVCACRLARVAACAHAGLRPAPCAGPASRLVSPVYLLCSDPECPGLAPTDRCGVLRAWPAALPGRQTQGRQPASSPPSDVGIIATSRLYFPRLLLSCKCVARFNDSLEYQGPLVLSCSLSCYRAPAPRLRPESAARTAVSVSNGGGGRAEVSRALPRASDFCPAGTPSTCRPCGRRALCLPRASAGHLSPDQIHLPPSSLCFSVPTGLPLQ